MKLLSKLKHFIYYGLGGVSQSIASLLVLPFITGKLTIEDYGVYSMITLCGSIASSLFYLGVTSALPRYYLGRDNAILRENALGCCNVLILTGACIQILFASLFGSMISKYLFNTEVYGFHLKVIFIGYAFLFLNQYVISFWRINNLSFRIFYLGLINIIINFIGIYTGFIYFKNSLYVPIVIFLTIQILQFVISIIISKDLLHFCIDKNLLRSILKFGLGAVVIGGSTLVVDWFDRFVINELLSLRDVAIYSFSYKLGSFINILLISPYLSVWIPYLMEKRMDADINHIIERVISIYILLGVAFTTLSALFVQDVLFYIISYEKYADAIQYFPVIMLGIMIYGLINFYSIGYIFEKKIYELTRIYIFVALVNIVLTYIFVKKFKIMGATYSSVVTYILIAMMVYFDGKKYIRIKVKQTKIVFYVSLCLSIILFRNAFFYNNSSKLLVIKIIMFITMGIIVYLREFKTKKLF